MRICGESIEENKILCGGWLPHGPVGRALPPPRLSNEHGSGRGSLMRGEHKNMHELCDSVGVGTFAVSNVRLVFSLVFFCKRIVYIGVTAEHELTDLAATN